MSPRFGVFCADVSVERGENAIYLTHHGRTGREVVFA